MMTETDKMEAAVMNQEALRTPSPRPIIFMYSFSRSSFSCTMPRTVMATGNSQAKIMARGNTHSMALVNLRGGGGAVGEWEGQEVTGSEGEGQEMSGSEGEGQEVGGSEGEAQVATEREGEAQQAFILSVLDFSTTMVKSVVIRSSI